MSSPNTSIYVAKRCVHTILMNVDWPSGMNGIPSVFYGPPTHYGSEEVVVVGDPDDSSSFEWVALSTQRPMDERFNVDIYIECGGLGWSAINSDARAEELLGSVLNDLRVNAGPGFPAGLVLETTSVNTKLQIDADGEGMWTTVKIRVGFWCRTRLG